MTQAVETIAMNSVRLIVIITSFKIQADTLFRYQPDLVNRLTLISLQTEQ